MSTDERRARAALPEVQKSAAIECRTQPCRTTKGCMCYQITQAAIRAIRASDEAAGMVLVPREATEEMIQAGANAQYPMGPAEVWRAMLAAATEADHG